MSETLWSVVRYFFRIQSGDLLFSGTPLSRGLPLSDWTCKVGVTTRVDSRVHTLVGVDVVHLVFLAGQFESVGALTSSKCSISKSRDLIVTIDFTFICTYT